MMVITAKGLIEPYEAQSSQTNFPKVEVTEPSRHAQRAWPERRRDLG
jgi:hypothetical protein